MNGNKPEYQSLTITSALAQVLTTFFYLVGLDVEQQSSYALAFLIVQFALFLLTRYGRLRAETKVNPIV